MKLNIYLIFTLILLFTLSLLMMVLLSNLKKSKANIFFLLFYLSQTLTFANILLYNVQNWTPIVYQLHNIAPPLWFTWAPLLYFAVAFELHKLTRFTINEFLHFLPALMFFIYLIVAYHIKPIESKMDIVNQGNLFYIKHYNLFHYSNIVQVLVYNLLTIGVVKKYLLSNSNLTKKQKNKVSWLHFIVYGYLVVCLIYAFSVVFNQATQKLVVGIFCLYFAVILYRTLSNSYFSFSLDNNRNERLPNRQAVQLQKQLNDYFKLEKPYLDFELSLSKLAQQLNTKEVLISELISTYYKSNFYGFINNYRIAHAKDLLADETAASKTILEILYESGYNSKSTFNAAFKKATGMSPSQYRKSLAG